MRSIPVLPACLGVLPVGVLLRCLRLVAFRGTPSRRIYSRLLGFVLSVLILLGAALLFGCSAIFDGDFERGYAAEGYFEPELGLKHAFELQHDSSRTVVHFRFAIRGSEYPVDALYLENETYLVRNNPDQALQLGKNASILGFLPPHLATNVEKSDSHGIPLVYSTSDGTVVLTSIRPGADTRFDFPGDTRFFDRHEVIFQVS